MNSQTTRDITRQIYRRCVLDAQRTVLEAELALIQTEQARLTTMVALFKALGGGWQQEQLAQVQQEK